MPVSTLSVVIAFGRRKRAANRTLPQPSMQDRRFSEQEVGEVTRESGEKQVPAEISRSSGEKKGLASASGIFLAGEADRTESGRGGGKKV